MATKKEITIVKIIALVKESFLENLPSDENYLNYFNKLKLWHILEDKIIKKISEKDIEEWL